MAKRGDKKRKKSRRKRRRTGSDSEGFQIGPLTVERHGLNVVHRVDMEHPEYAAYRELVDEQIANLPTELGRLRADLRELFAPFDAFDVIAYLWLINVPSDPDTYRESADEGMLAIPESAAAVLIERSSRVGEDPNANFWEVAERAQELCKEFLFTQAFAFMHEASTRHADDPVYGEIRGLARSHRLAVRGPSYWWQEEQTIRDLFGEAAIEPLVKASAGFTAEEGVVLGQAMSEFGLQKLRERMEEARAFARRLVQDFDRVREGKEPASPEHAGIIANLAHMNREQAVRRIGEMAVAWGSFATGSVFEFTAQDLAHFAGVGTGAATAFLGAFSTPFGHFASQDRPPQLEDLREGPILVDDTGAHICISPHNVLWGLRFKLEDALKRDQRRFSTYERHRAVVVERRAVNALAAAVDADWSHVGLFYEITEDGETKRPELDGIVRVDDVVYLIEVKASSMRPSARRAAPEALRDWLEDELAKAAQQARRARNALFGGHPAPIFDADGRPVELDLEGVRIVIEMVVTLEDLAAIAPLSWKLADAGLIPADPVPWVVSLHELEIICEVAARPAELVHYTLRRQRLNERRDAWAVDELDYFMHYLLAGLYWEGEGRGNPVHLLSHTDDLDSYYAHAKGQRRKKAKRPGQAHSKKVEALLSCLSDHHEPGALTAAIAILDVDKPVRDQIAGFVSDLRVESARDRRFHDRSIVAGDLGITVMSAPPDSSDELTENLLGYCRLKKHQLKAARWIGLGVFAGPPEPIQVVAVLREPWQPDAELDELVQNLPTYGVEGDFDGRAPV